MKTKFFLLKSLLLAAAVLTVPACDETETGLTYTAQPFHVGQVTWAPDVTASDRAVITELINSMVRVDSCLFHMGAQYATSKAANYFSGYQASDTATWVGPVLTVSMPDYYIARYEVTQGQWRAVMGDVLPTGRYCKLPDVERNAPWYAETGLGDRIAAYNISHADALAFCRELSRKTGLPFRLPTEAEWECAARGGRYSKGYRYIGAESIDEVAWYKANASDPGVGATTYGVHAGGERQPNELGLCDMNGNVAEWVAGSYYKYSAADTINPQGPATLGDTLILRGGSWVQGQARDFCPANRKKFIVSSYPTEESFHSAIAFCGLRVALSVQ